MWDNVDFLQNRFTFCTFLASKVYSYMLFLHGYLCTYYEMIMTITLLHVMKLMHIS